MGIFRSSAIKTEVVGHLQRGHTPDRRYTAVVTVTDSKLRQELGQNFDGMEKLYARVPVDKGNGKVKWVTKPMKWIPGPPDSDRHVLALSEKDNAAIRANGVAFFLKTNVKKQGDWLQNIGQNTMPWTPAIGQP